MKVVAVCVLLLAAFVAGSDGRRHVKHQPGERPPRTCLYGNATYPGGSRFRPDPCTACRCPKRGSRPYCVMEDCKYDPECVTYVKSPESLCCDVCVERGCRHSDGHVYRPGEVVSRRSCTTCRCPEGGGRIECGHVPCPEINCVDPVYDPGACCLTCPNGANCWLGHEILAAGRIVTRNRCKTCRCPDERLPSWLMAKGPRAICSITKC